MHVFKMHEITLKKLFIYMSFSDTFEEQVRKEIAYREEVAKQLQIVRGKYLLVS